MSKKMFFLDFVILLAISIIACRYILFSSGPILLNDLTFPLTRIQVLNQLVRFSFAWDYFSTCGRDDLVVLQTLGFWVLTSIATTILGAEFSLKLWLMLIPILSSWSMYGMTYYLTKKRFAAFLAALCFAYNPWVVNRMISGHLLLLLSYSLGPIISVFFIKSVDDDKTKRAVVVGFLLSFIASSSGFGHITIIWIAIISLYAFFQIPWFSGWRKSILQLKRNLLKLVVSLTVLGLISMYYLLPIIYITTTGAEPYYVFTNFPLEDVSRLSERAMLLNLMRMAGYWVPISDEAALAYPSLASWLRSSSFFVSLLAFTSIFLHPKNKHIRFFTFLAIFSMLLATGAQGPFGIYFWLYKNVPGFSAFRDPDKFVAAACLAYAFLVGTAIDSIWRRLHLFGKSRVESAWSFFKRLKSKVKVVLFASYVLLPLLFSSSLPILSGNFCGFQPVNVPKEYITVNIWLADHPEDFRVFWLPPWFPCVQYNWSRQIFSDPVIYYISGKPAVSYSMATLPTSGFLRFLIAGMLQNRTMFLGKLLGIANTKYIILRNDTIPPQDVSLFNQTLMHQMGLQLIRHDGSLYVFENEYSLPHFFTPSNGMLIIGNRDALISMSYLEGLDFNKWLMVFADQAQERSSGLEKGLKYLVFCDRSIDDLAFSFVGSDYRIEPWHHANQTMKTDQCWVKYGWNWWLHPIDPIMDFSFLLPEISLGEDFVLTEGKARLDVPFDVHASDVYDLWIRAFSGPCAGRFSVLVDDVSVSDFSLHASNYLGLEWIKVGSIFLAKGRHKVSLLNEDGFNVVDLMVAIPPNELEKLFQRAYSLANKQNARVFFVLEAEKAFAQSRLGWSVDLESFGSSASRGEAINAIGWAEASTKLLIPRASNYMIALRASGKNNGNLTLIIDDWNATVQTPQTFDFVYAGPIFLDAGHHDIIVMTKDSVALDQVILYSLYDSEKYVELPPLFDVTSPASVHYKKVNPCEYDIEIETKEPVFLAFSESYHPLWKAYYNGEELKTAVAYSFINCFYLDARSAIDVKLEFTPQRYVNHGAQVTVVSLLAILCLLLIAHKLEKNLVRRDLQNSR